MFYRAYFEQFNVDMFTPIQLYYSYVKDEIGFLLESKDGSKGRYSIIGRKPKLTIYSTGDHITIEQDGKKVNEQGKVLERLKAIMANYQVVNQTDIPFVGGAVGIVGYDLIRQYENLPSVQQDDLELPEIHQMLVEESILYDHFNQSIIIVVLQKDNTEGKQKANSRIAEIWQQINEEEVRLKSFQPNKERLEVKENMTKAQYIESVERAKAYIEQGDIFQVVLSRRVQFKTPQDSLTLYRKLRQINPSAYMYYINFGDYQVVGSSPEMLVELREDKIYTCPIAGTRKRGKDAKEDEGLAKELLADEKENAEHIMLVDLARNDMGRVAKIDSVKVTSFKQVKFYSHVMHILSLVEGIKREEEDMFSILSTFLPAGTLSGAPKIRAMEIIEELETTKRGLYGGAVGYFGFNQNMDMCIAIRTMVIKNGKVTIQSGAGIVADSDPQKEYEESCNKAGALIEALNQ